MELCELFSEDTPLRGNVVLDVRGEPKGGRPLFTITARQCDGTLPKEFNTLRHCTVLDTVSDTAAANQIRIVVLLGKEDADGSS